MKVLKEFQTLSIISLEGQLQNGTLRPVVGDLLLKPGDAELHKGLGEDVRVNHTQLVVNLHLRRIQLVAFNHRGQYLVNSIKSQIIITNTITLPSFAFR